MGGGGGLVVVGAGGLVVGGRGVVVVVGGVVVGGVVVVVGGAVVVVVDDVLEESAICTPGDSAGTLVAPAVSDRPLTTSAEITVTTSAIVLALRVAAGRRSVSGLVPRPTCCAPEAVPSTVLLASIFDLQLDGSLHGN